MAAARLQMVLVSPAAHMQVPSEPETGAGSGAEIPQAWDGEFVSEFMSLTTAASQVQWPPDYCPAAARRLHESPTSGRCSVNQPT